MKQAKRSSTSFDAVLERFEREAPVSVMARLALGRALSPEWMEGLFEAEAERQYTRELLFSTVVELMTVVAVGLRPSLHAAAQAMGRQALGASVAALYEKVGHMEPHLVRSLVTQGAERLLPVLQAVRGAAGGSRAAEGGRASGGYALRVVDGNHLPGSHKRLKALRGLRRGALPGLALMVYAPEEGLVVDMVPEEDAHASERALMPQVFARAKAGELWLADRNFSTRPIMRGLHGRGVHFLIREHSLHPHPTVVGPRRSAGRIETGHVYVEDVLLPGEEEVGQRALPLRRVEIELDVPTEEGDTRIRLLTDVPANRLGPRALARLYRERWTVENMFQRLESALHSEVRSLGKPRAALFALGCATLAFNVLALLEAAVTAAHPEAADKGLEVSTYYVAHDVRALFAGMAVALPAEAWSRFDAMAPTALAAVVLRVARHVRMDTLRKHPRKPKPKRKKGYVPSSVARSQVSTARILAGKGAPQTP